ncbi:S49 family peptidase [Pseudomonas sp. JL972]|uniref:S49 family peptidase n=1 Tax=Stutzerimonas degradans TaxID=2968968 RepID=UPI0012D88023|nr:S49 family peptidase [Stutzerimonas degradans]MTZ15099.1 S49 family peptidase [Stutzerimonas degradans]
MKRHLRASSLLFNQPLLVTPEMLDLGVGWANQVMHLNIVNIGSAGLGDAKLWHDDEDYGARMERVEESRRQAIARTGVEVIPVSGILVSRGAHLEACEVMTSYEDLRRQLRTAVADPMVERIVLDIDSPGGSAVGAFELATEIRAMTQQKPITGLVNFMAYSGGYLLASACSEVVVSKTSGIGSIGVIAKHLDRSKLEENAGVKVTTVFAGAHKNDMSPHEPLTEQSLKFLNDLVQESYQMFVGAVAEYRGLSIEQVMATEAALYQGQHGINAGLADRLQSPQDAVDQLSRIVAESRTGRGAGGISVRARAAAIQSQL